MYICCYKGGKVIEKTSEDLDEILEIRASIIIQHFNSKNLPKLPLRLVLRAITSGDEPSNDERILDCEGIFNLLLSRKTGRSCVWGICRAEWILCEIIEGSIMVKKYNSPFPILETTDANPYEMLKWLDVLVMKLIRGKPEIIKLLARRPQKALTEKPNMKAWL